MRAAPGFAPRAIARSSRRIDIAKALFDGARVAEIGESGVNPGAASTLLIARCGPGKWQGRAKPRSSAAVPEGSHLLTYFEVLRVPALRARFPEGLSFSNALRTLPRCVSSKPVTFGNARSSRSSAATIAPATTRRANDL